MSYPTAELGLRESDLAPRSRQATLVHIPLEKFVPEPIEHSVKPEKPKPEWVKPKPPIIPDQPDYNYAIWEYAVVDGKSAQVSFREYPDRGVLEIDADRFRDHQPQKFVLKKDAGVLYYDSTKDKWIMIPVDTHELHFNQQARRDRFDFLGHPLPLADAVLYQCQEFTRDFGDGPVEPALIFIKPGARGRRGSYTLYKVMGQAVQEKDTPSPQRRKPAGEIIPPMSLVQAPYPIESDDLQLRQHPEAARPKDRREVVIVAEARPQRPRPERSSFKQLKVAVAQFMQAFTGAKNVEKRATVSFVDKERKPDAGIVDTAEPMLVTLVFTPTQISKFTRSMSITHTFGANRLTIQYSPEGNSTITLAQNDADMEHPVTTQIFYSCGQNGDTPENSGESGKSKSYNQIIFAGSFGDMTKIFDVMSRHAAQLRKSPPESEYWIPPDWMPYQGQVPKKFRESTSQ